MSGPEQIALIPANRLLLSSSTRLIAPADLGLLGAGVHFSPLALAQAGVDPLCSGMAVARLLLRVEASIKSSIRCAVCRRPGVVVLALLEVVPQFRALDGKASSRMGMASWVRASVSGKVVVALLAPWRNISRPRCHRQQCA